MFNHPLANITVISIEQAVAVPFATRQLADLGARVIKIERPGQGDFARHYDQTVNGLSSNFVWLNRSKESLTLDLKQAEGQAILTALLAQADVFIQNLAPGAIDRLGFGAKALRQKWPQLIVCGVSGYGTAGPYQHKKAYDLLIQAEAGLVSITGTEETPSKAGISIADIAAGMYAYSGILTALFTRLKTGQGTSLEISMLEALGEWMSYPAYYGMYGGTAPARTGSSHAAITPYGLFPSGDSKTVFFGLQNEQEWARFCSIVLQQPGLRGDARFDNNSSRTANKAVLRRIIEASFLDLTLETIVERFETAKIAYAQMRSVQEFWDHPQLKARDRWREIDSPVGPLQSLIPPVTMAGVEPVMGPIPNLGQHNALILGELGYDDQEVARLQDLGVV